MEHIEEILARHHISPASSNRASIRLRKYMNPVEFALNQKQIYTRSNWYTPHVSPKKQSIFQTTMSQFKVKHKASQGYVKRNARNMYDYANQEQKECSLRQTKKQFSMTIYPNDNKPNNYSLQHRSRTLDKLSQKQEFQLKANRFPIMRQKQSKRNQLVKSLKKQGCIAPQLQFLLKKKQNSLLQQQKKQSLVPAELQKIGLRKTKKSDICGWDGGDSFQD